jgi:tRNA-binding protein
VEDFPEVRKPTYKPRIDFGELGIERSSALIKHLYSKKYLLGKQILGVVNFPLKQAATFFSQVLTTGSTCPAGRWSCCILRGKCPTGQSSGRAFYSKFTSL